LKSDLRTMVVTTLKAGGGQLFTMLLTTISVKILALTVGPAGMGLFSLLRNAQQTLTILATLGGQNAIVQGVASLKKDTRAQYINAAFWMSLCSAIVICLGLILFASQLAPLLLEARYVHVLPWIIVPTALGAAMVFFRGILNANLEINSVIWVNVAVALGALLSVYPALTAFKAGYSAALIFVLAGSFGVGAIVAISFVYSKGYFSEFIAALRFIPTRGAVSHFARIAFPTLIASFAGMGTILFIRSLITKGYGLSAAGHFDAAWSIGAMYLTLFLTSLQTYLLPAMSARGADFDFKNLVRTSLHLSVMATVPIVISLIVLKPIVVRLLYSADFLPALDTLRWMLLGDLIRVGGWVLATALVARADMLAFLVRELAWNIVFASLGWYLMPNDSASAGYAYIVAYTIYFVMHVWRIWRRHSISIDLRTSMEWAAGFCLIVLASILTWSDIKVEWTHLFLIVLGGLFSWMVMTKNERDSLLLRLENLAKRAMTILDSAKG
jgi:O-antigen/teichoic acid export membrane protein